MFCPVLSCVSESKTRFTQKGTKRKKSRFVPRLCLCLWLLLDKPGKELLSGKRCQFDLQSWVKSGASDGWKQGPIRNLLCLLRICLAQSEAHHITHVLNCADDVPNFHEQEGLTYLRLDIADFGGDAGACRTFPCAIEFVSQASGRVLIHCANGSNRSATVTVAVCMGLFNMNLAQAWSLVRSRRPQTLPLADNRKELLFFEGSRDPEKLVSMAEGAGGLLMPVGASSGDFLAVGSRVRLRHTGVGGLVWELMPDGGALIRQDCALIFMEVPEGSADRYALAHLDKTIPCVACVKIAVFALFSHTKTHTFFCYLFTLKVLVCSVAWPRKS